MHFSKSNEVVRFRLVSGAYASFWGKANDELFKGFIKPLFKVYTEGMKQKVNLVNYDAPLTMYFYGSPFTDPATQLLQQLTQ